MYSSTVLSCMVLAVCINVITGKCNQNISLSSCAQYCPEIEPYSAIYPIYRSQYKLKCCDRLQKYGSCPPDDLEIYNHAVDLSALQCCSDFDCPDSYKCCSEVNYEYPYKLCKRAVLPQEECPDTQLTENSTKGIIVEGSGSIPNVLEDDTERDSDETDQSNEHNANGTHLPVAEVNSREEQNTDPDEDQRRDEDEEGSGFSRINNEDDDTETIIEEPSVDENNSNKVYQNEEEYYDDNEVHSSGDDEIVGITKENEDTNSSGFGNKLQTKESEAISRDGANELVLKEIDIRLRESDYDQTQNDDHNEFEFIETG